VFFGGARVREVMKRIGCVLTGFHTRLLKKSNEETNKTQKDEEGKGSNHPIVR